LSDFSRLSVTEVSSGQTSPAILRSGLRASGGNVVCLISPGICRSCRSPARMRELGRKGSFQAGWWSAPSVPRARVRCSWASRGFSAGNRGSTFEGGPSEFRRARGIWRKCLCAKPKRRGGKTRRLPVKCDARRPRRHRKPCIGHCRRLRTERCPLAGRRPEILDAPYGILSTRKSWENVTDDDAADSRASPRLEGVAQAFVEGTAGLGRAKCGFLLAFRQARRRSP